MGPLQFLEKSKNFLAALEHLRNKQKVCVVGGENSFFAYLVCGFFSRVQEPVFVLLPDEVQAEKFFQDAGNFVAPESIQLLPGPALESEDNLTEEASQRVPVLVNLARKTQPFLTVACLSAVLRKIPSAAGLMESEFRLVPGAPLRRDQLLKRLLALGYEEKELIELPGEFARRGAIVDIFPPHADFPVRVELLDNRVTSLREFEPASQRSFDRIPGISIFPLREDFIPGGCSASLFGLLEKELVFLLEPETFQTEKSLSAVLKARKEEFISPEELERLKEKSQIMTKSFSNRYQAWNNIHFPVFPVSDRFRIGETFVWNRTTQERLFIFSSNVSQEHRLKEILESRKVSPDRIAFCQGTLSSGFHFPEIDTSFLSNDEIFSRYQTRHVPQRRLDRIPLADREELKEGDFVVHYNEGIGRFLGMKKLKVKGGEEEFVMLEYAAGDKLYVPLSQIPFLHKYVGARHPELARLGSKSWLKVREKVRVAIRDLAADLAKLYVERKKGKGISFPRDDDWQREFEDSFIYQETPDQNQAIAEVKQDMISDKIMDRLVCGDSGYGKTEVAMRASFKAVLAGKQVAVLVPTTVLALQHYFTFKERFADFPVRVEMLCRFVPESKQAWILKETREGRVDIVIGTHRLLSVDVGFKDLGLLIFDEEQRFGVTHKEKIKALFRKVDVLTLSATPIPRTLYLSLSGIRDISLIETPPLGRLSVITHVGMYQDRLVQEAIVRELERKGQVFYLHNFVYDIENVRERLQKLVPEATIEVAHGRMEGKVLEKVMERFSFGMIDVLVATSIVENGLDIPRANTLIVDNAHRFGLADLYQLRGRVGRYKWRAYAYFLVPPHIYLTRKAQKRLEVLQELNKPGSGFQVALQDLEIRGMGNILGQEQHGFIEQVGFHLYCQFWKEMARTAAARPVLETAALQISEPQEVKFEEAIPPDYVSTPGLRFWLYRRIAETKGAERTELLKELQDRFGPVPAQLRKILQVNHNS